MIHSNQSAEYVEIYDEIHMVVLFFDIFFLYHIRKFIAPFLQGPQITCRKGPVHCQERTQFLGELRNQKTMRVGGWWFQINVFRMSPK